jgi:GntR family transcriptional regulator
MMLGDRITSPLGKFANRPLYLQLRDALAERIAGGNWRPGSAIPNESDLAREFGVSAGTMRKALDLMEAERLLSRRQGRGTFVNDQSSNELALRFSNLRHPDGSRMCGQVKSIEIAEATANEIECVRLGLRVGDGVYRISRSRHHNGQTFLVEDVSLPASLFPALPHKAGLPHRIIELAQEYGLLRGQGGGTRVP